MKEKALKSISKINKIQKLCIINAILFVIL